MTMYEKFSKLLQENKVTPYRIHKETGISTATLSDWKNGKSEPKRDKIQKICDFFNVSISYFYEDDHEDGNNAAQEEPTLTPKDERDIARKLEETLNQLDSHDGLMFDGDALDDETKELLRASLENSLRIGKINAKKKYTPKKYRKSEN